MRHVVSPRSSLSPAPKVAFLVCLTTHVSSPITPYDSVLCQLQRKKMADQEPAKSPAPEAPAAATATTTAGADTTTTTTETSAPPPAEDPAPADPPSAQVAAQEAASGLLPGQHWGNLTEVCSNGTRC